MMMKWTEKKQSLIFLKVGENLTEKKPDTLLLADVIESCLQKFVEEF